VQSKINFWGNEKRGFDPMGMKAVILAANVEKVTYWHRGKAPYTYGVLLFQPRVVQKTIDEVISKIFSVYPVHDGMKRMAVIVFEKGTMRGIHAVGDYDDVVRFWTDLSIGTCAVSSLDTTKDSICWTVMNPTHYFIPYIDIDELGTQSDFAALWTTRVNICIGLVQSMLRKWQEDPVFQIFFNARPSDKHPGLFKYSFHVHFYKSLVSNINSFKEAIKKLPGMPHKREWTRTGPTAYSVKEDSRGFIFDSAVYGGRKQLFRGPFCGKNGNTAAAMIPIDVNVSEGGVPVIVAHAEEDVDARSNYIFLSRISSPFCEAAGMVVCGLPLESESQPQASPAVDGDIFTPHNINDGATDRPTATYDFFKPLVYNELLTAWQSRREADARSLRGSGWTIPLVSLSVSKDIRHPNKPFVRVLKISGDTFCETDPAHFHSRNPHTVTICVDLHKCLIWQNCFACSAPGPKYHFLHTGNRVVVRKPEESKLTHEEFFHPVTNPYVFLLEYFSDLFCLHKPTETLYVLDTDSVVWRTGSTANGVVGKLFDLASSKYIAYIQERQASIMEETLAHVLRSQPDLSPEDIEKKRSTLLADGRKFISKYRALAQLPVSARGKLIDDLRNFPVRLKVNDMNTLAHVIPMRNLQAYDVFTGETHEFQSRHLFTSIVDAELTSDTNDLALVDKWFTEIATGDKEKARYLKIISGYMMTFLMHDRKFYVLKGTGKNGKGIHKQFLVSILSGARGTDARWKALNQNFWERKANSNSGAEAPSPEAHGMLNKTLFYTDDIERVAIEAGKVKRVVAGEVMSGRGLFSKPVVVEPKGKILWTTNHTIDLPGNDNAAWERFSQIDYNTKYVEKPELVDYGNFRLLQNDVAVQELLLKTDAFFTIATRELTHYYKSLTYNPATGQPSTLTHFPVPASVNVAKAEARSQQLPLANFMRSHAAATDQPLFYSEIGAMFAAYITFLENENERRIRNETTQTSFIRQLATSLEIKCTATRVIGWKLEGDVHKKQRRDQDYDSGSRVSADADVQ
jgi:hypothetical protein